MGNVLATVSDKKLGHNAGNGQIDYYLADVVSASDYYPFGMGMPGRKYTAPNSGYRYGFNGKEMDNEVSGEGNQYDYGFRIYNPRLGRFLSVDPLMEAYPWYTPYQFAGNNPIWAIDLDGLEEQKVDEENKGESNPNETFKNKDGSDQNLTLQNVVVKSKSKSQPWYQRAWNYTKKEILPRVVGGLKTVGGAALVVGGAALSEFGIGVPIAVYGADLAQAGARQVIDGENHKTLHQQGFEAAGLAENDAALLDMAMGTAYGTTVAPLQLAPPKATPKSYKVDLFGGKNGTQGYTNYDLENVSATGITDDVANFGNHFKGQIITEVQVNNPQVRFLNIISNSLTSGTTVTVRGTISNNKFREIYNERQKD